MELIYFLFYAVIAIFSLAILFLRNRYTYWQRRGVVHDKPVWFYGNIKGIMKDIPFHQPFSDFYEKYKNVAPFGGFYLMMRHAVVIFDLDLVKTILIKDFSNFAHRGNYYNEKDDPLTGHLFNLDGPKWRKMRNKLTPAFTSGRMKFMFPTLVEVADKFVTVLSGEVNKTNIGDDSNKEKLLENYEIRELCARFTTDVIGSCAFGLECNSLLDPNAKFRVMGRKVFSQRRHKAVVNSIMNAFPELSRKLGMKAITDDINDFFMNVVKETVEYREREGIQRNDFMNMLIEMKNQNVDDDGLSLGEIAAQAFVFFVAGFETSSSTMSFCLYELAINQHIQDKARAEIEEMFERYEGKLTYEGIKELTYLRQILQETMRLYSIATILIRRTVDDYPVPNTKHVIEKGTVIIVPVHAIHRDANIYPNPDVFDPDRFTQSAIEKRHPMSWLPFGEGPRNCIGLRFGEMQAIVGLTVLLKNFRFSPTKTTQIPLQFDPKNFLLAAMGGIPLKIEML